MKAPGEWRTGTTLPLLGKEKRKVGELHEHKERESFFIMNSELIMLP